MKFKSLKVKLLVLLLGIIIIFYVLWVKLCFCSECRYADLYGIRQV